MTAFGDRFRAGINLGGWLSQYGTFDHDHFERFVDRSDSERIASWGMDHVRLPIDYPVLLDDAGDGYDERGFGYVDQCVEWCREHDLGVILDLHRAPGYTFNDPEGSQLFETEAYQDRFIDLWTEIAGRYDSAGDEVAFELLNEVVDPPAGKWNALVERTVEAIRTVDTDRTVIVGGPEYNAVSALDSIDLLEDDNVAYTFHFYEPLLFTHQYASWLEAAEDYATTVAYPGSFPELDSFLADNPTYAEQFDALIDERIDREWIETALEPAVEFRKETGAELYCGEFGVIDQAPIESRIAWTRDVVAVLDDLDIGYAYWSYREMDFGLIDENQDVVSEDLIGVVSP